MPFLSIIKKKLYSSLFHFLNCFPVFYPPFFFYLFLCLFLTFSSRAFHFFYSYFSFIYSHFSLIKESLFFLLLLLFFPVFRVFAFFIFLCSASSLSFPSLLLSIFTFALSFLPIMLFSSFLFVKSSKFYLTSFFPGAFSYLSIFTLRNGPRPAPVTAICTYTFLLVCIWSIQHASSLFNTFRSYLLVSFAPA